MTQSIPPYVSSNDIPISHEEAEAQMERVFKAGGCKTQTELARLFGISQSSISDAKRRGKIPADWLVKLLRLRGVNPDWILLGTGPKFLTPSDDPENGGSFYESFPLGRATDALVIQNLLKSFPANYLVTELVRRRESG